MTVGWCTFRNTIHDGRHNRTFYLLRDFLTVNGFLVKSIIHRLISEFILKDTKVSEKRRAGKGRKGTGRDGRGGEGGEGRRGEKEEGVVQGSYR